MNRLFNAQNNPGLGLSVDIVFTSDTTCKFLNRVTQQEITQQMALQGEEFRVVPYLQKDSSATHYGNYGIYSRSNSSITLRLMNRAIRLMDPFNFSYQLIEYKLPDYWAAHFKGGSPVYDITFTANQLTVTTLWEAQVASREFRNFDEDGTYSFEILDQEGNVIGSTKRYVTEMIKASMVPPFTGNPSWGMNSWVSRGSQGQSRGENPFSLRFDYESSHSYKLLLDNDLAYEGSSGEFASGSYVKEWYKPTPEFVAQDGYTANISAIDTYFDIDLVDFYGGAVPSEDLDVTKITLSPWLLSIDPLDLTTHPTIRLRFAAMGSRATNSVSLRLKGTDFNNQVPFEVQMNLTLKTN